MSDVLNLPTRVGIFILWVFQYLLLDLGPFFLGPNNLPIIPSAMMSEDLSYSAVHNDMFLFTSPLNSCMIATRAYWDNQLYKEEGEKV